MAANGTAWPGPCAADVASEVATLGEDADTAAGGVPLGALPPAEMMAASSGRTTQACPAAAVASPLKLPGDLAFRAGAVVATIAFVVVLAAAPAFRQRLAHAGAVLPLPSGRERPRQALLVMLTLETWLRCPWHILVLLLTTASLMLLASPSALPLRRGAVELIKRLPGPPARTRLQQVLGLVVVLDLVLCCPAHVSAAFAAVGALLAVMSPGAARLRGLALQLVPRMSRERARQVLLSVTILDTLLKFPKGFWLPFAAAAGLMFLAAPAAGPLREKALPLLRALPRAPAKHLLQKALFGAAMLDALQCLAPGCPPIWLAALASALAVCLLGRLFRRSLPSIWMLHRLFVVVFALDVLSRCGRLLVCLCLTLAGFAALPSQAEPARQRLLRGLRALPHAPGRQTMCRALLIATIVESLLAVSLRPLQVWFDAVRLLALAAAATAVARLAGPRLCSAARPFLGAAAARVGQWLHQPRCWTWPRSFMFSMVQPLWQGVWWFNDSQPDSFGAMSGEPSPWSLFAIASGSAGLAAAVAGTVAQIGALPARMPWRALAIAARCDVGPSIARAAAVAARGAAVGAATVAAAAGRGTGIAGQYLHIAAAGGISAGTGCLGVALQWAAVAARAAALAVGQLGGGGAALRAVELAKCTLGFILEAWCAAGLRVDPKLVAAAFDRASKQRRFS